jgi:hypothetical protein
MGLTVSIDLRERAKEAFRELLTDLEPLLDDPTKNDGVMKARWILATLDQDEEYLASHPWPKSPRWTAEPLVDGNRDGEYGIYDTFDEQGTEGPVYTAQDGMAAAALVELLNGAEDRTDA